MTGYGKAKTQRPELDIEIEIKSINGRYLDLRLYLPRDLSFFEHTVRKVISSRISRGTVDVRVSYTDHREPNVQINRTKLIKYRDIINEAMNALDLNEEIPIELLLNEPGVIETKSSLDEDSLLAGMFNETLSKAIDQLDLSLSAEAVSIKQIIESSLESIDCALNSVESEIQPYKENLFANMQERIRDILKTNQSENLEQRLFQELAIYIDRYDIHEELTRLRSHISTMRLTMDKPGDNGKGLNFVLQEMQREANTLGSKFSTAATFSSILIIKEEIEKCREIIQNVA